ncbi:MAG: hypothetical protein JXJ20_10580 [Anaerolineae bacterium]|nr:hypothetical protein [Anaerolineae bacterium]
MTKISAGLIGLLGVCALAGPGYAASPGQRACQPTEFGETVHGVITDESPEICYTFEGQINQHIWIEMRAAEDSGLDPMIRLNSAAGLMMVSSDNTGDDLDARIEDCLLMMPGEYVLIATRSGGVEGTTVGAFELSINLHAQSINPAQVEAPVIALGETVSGRVTASDSRVFYELAGRDGQLVMARVEAAGGDLAPYVALHKVVGDRSVIVAENEATGAGGAALVGPVLLRDAAYRIEVSHAGDAGEGAFSLTVEEPDRIVGGEALTYGKRVVGEMGVDRSSIDVMFDAAAGDVIAVRLGLLAGTGSISRASLEVFREANGERHPVAASENPTAPGIPVLLLEQGGTYRVTVTALAGEGVFWLAVDLLQTGGQPYTAEIETITPGDTVSGTIGYLDYERVYRFEIGAGWAISAVMRATGGELDPYLVLRRVMPDGARQVVAENDNHTAFDTKAAIQELYLELGGVYEIVATRTLGEHGGSTGTYALTLTALSPDEQPERPDPRPVPAAGQHGAWTVLVYFAADNNLEAPLFADYNELELVGSSENVRFVVQMDRSQAYSREDTNWYGARRWAVGQDYNRYMITSPPVDDLGETDSGDVAALEDFLLWGIERYPADHYALIISDHGSGWNGIAWDHEAGNHMAVIDLAETLARVSEIGGIGRFDVVAFDACLMGALEVADALAPAADVIVASAQLVDFNGFDYHGLAEVMLDHPDADARTFGMLLVQSFDDYYAPSGTNYMLATLDTAAIPAVVLALTDLIAVLEAEPARYDAVGDAYNRTFAYVADQYADLGHLAFNLALISDDPELVAAAGTLETAIDAAMLLYVSGPVGEDASGLSIYFPHYTQIDAVYGETLANPLWERWAGLVNDMND